MFNTPHPQQPDMGRGFLEGTTVFDAAGEKIGTISEQNIQGGYLIVQKGWLFQHDLYVPLAAIGNQDVNGVYLDLYKQDIKNRNWDQPPANLPGGAAVPPDLAAATPAGAASVSGGTPGGPGSAADFSGAPVSGMTAEANPINNPPIPPTPPQAPGPEALSTSRTDTGMAGTHATPIGAGDVAVPLREEELVVGKQEQEQGRVHLHKDVVEEQQTATAPVTREQVTIERIPVQGGNVNLGTDAFTEQDIDVPVMGEELVAGKRATVGEEVHLHKQAVTDEQQVSDTVRKERLNIEGANQAGNSPLEGTNQAGQIPPQDEQHP